MTLRSDSGIHLSLVISGLSLVAYRLFRKPSIFGSSRLTVDCMIAPLFSSYFFLASVTIFSPVAMSEATFGSFFAYSVARVAVSLARAVRLLA